MLLIPHRPSYRLCNQVVSVYHRNTNGSISMNTYRAYLDFKKNRNVDKTGRSDSSSFLLVVPTSKSVIEIGDKVLLGSHEPITDWVNFIPAKVPGLCVVKYVDYKYSGGMMVHQEAGG